MEQEANKARKRVTATYLDISIAIILVEFNKVPSFELQELKEDARGGAARNPLAYAVKGQNLRLARLLSRHRHVPLQHAVDLGGVLVPLGGTRDSRVSGFLTRFVSILNDIVRKVVDEAERKSRFSGCLATSSWTCINEFERVR